MIASSLIKPIPFFTEFRNSFKASDLIKVLDENYKPEVIEMVNSEDNKKKQRKNK